ncbi:MAG: glycosyltransferase family 2 protein [Candidatus Pseudoruminococcus sp.]|nr:glycosyltransferase [Ruminococcus sp.]MDY2783018.1 glycosyltransferase family 2 protein [Candidatus Pseudoruminococcus sp.]
MSSVSVSVIIPTRNVAENIANIIKSVSKNCVGLDVEYLIIDMNSTDSTVRNALNAIKANKLNGFVLQNGSSTVGSALNTGIYKASGKYISFVFARTLYSDFIPSYYELAEKNGADFVFASSKLSDEETKATAVGLNNIKGEDLAIAIARSIISVEIPAIMLRNDFVQENKILFSENCRRGYAEQYVYKIALANPKTAFSEFKLKKDTENQAPIKESNDNKELHILERVDAIREIAEFVESRFGNNRELCGLFRYEKLPDVIMNCVDTLLKNGVKPSSIRTAMKIKRCDEMLEVSKNAPNSLKKRVFIWKNFPKLYKPQ